MSVAKRFWLSPGGVSLWVRLATVLYFCVWDVMRQHSATTCELRDAFEYGVSCVSVLLSRGVSLASAFSFHASCISVVLSCMVSLVSVTICLCVWHVLYHQRSSFVHGASCASALFPCMVLLANVLHLFIIYTNSL